MLPTSRLVLAVLLATTVLSADATAQVLTFSGSYGGELSVDDIASFRQALQRALRTVDAEVLAADETAELLGELASCDGEDCARAAGEQVSASIGVYATVFAEAEIYDFAVHVYRLSDGERLVEQVGECTFCPIAEAIDSFRFTAEAAISAVGELPPPSTGPASAPVAQAEPEAPAEPQAPPILEGEVQFGISVVPSSAEIRVNGQVVGTGRANLMVAPQELVVTVHAEGYEDFTEDVTLTPAIGGPVFLRVALSQTATAGRQRQARPRDTDTGGGGFEGRALGGVLTGVGVLTTVGGIIALSLDGQASCADTPLSQCPEIYETTAGGVVLTTVGALATGTGLGLILASVLGGDGDTDQARGPGISLATSGDGAMIFVGGGF